MTTTMPDSAATPVEVRFGSPQKQNRWTVFFRGILIIPQAIVLVFLSIAALVVAIVGWFAALFTGRLPASMAEFLAGYVRWTTRVDGYGHFLTGKYPPFSLQPSEEYPIDIVVQGGRLNRWAVLFRIILAIPAYIVSTVTYYGLVIFSIIMWFAALFTGKLPPSFFEAAAATIRYRTRFNGYFLLLTSIYAGGLFGDEAAVGAAGPAAYAAPIPPVPATPPAPPTSEPAVGESVAPAAPPFAGESAPVAPPPPMAPAWTPETDPTAARGPASPWRLAVSQGGRVLIIVFIVLGVLAYVGQGVSRSGSNDTKSNAVGQLAPPAGAGNTLHLTTAP